MAIKIKDAKRPIKQRAVPRKVQKMAKKPSVRYTVDEEEFKSFIRTAHSDANCSVSYIVPPSLEKPFDEKNQLGALRQHFLDLQIPRTNEGTPVDQIRSLLNAAIDKASKDHRVAIGIKNWQRCLTDDNKYGGGEFNCILKELVRCSSPYVTILCHVSPSCDATK